MIFQDPYGSLNPRKTIGAAIREPMRCTASHAGRRGGGGGEPSARTRSGLEPRAPAALSRTNSRADSASASASRAAWPLEPTLIVADELVSALDVSIKAQVVNLMLDLQRELGLAYLFISHDISIVERVSHRVAVMLPGRIVEVGPREKVLGDPQHPYTRKLISAVPIPDPERRRPRRGLIEEELPSVIRPLDWQAPPSWMREVGTDHFILEETAG